MKLVKHTTTDFGNTDIFGNTQRSSHWGQKHYFLIENAPAAELEAIEDILDAAGWESDGCPCYEDGFTSGFHIDIEEVDAFKAAYKAAKKGLKEYMAIEAERAQEAEETAAEEAALMNPAFRAFWSTSEYSVLCNALNEWEAMQTEALAFDIERDRRRALSAERTRMNEEAEAEAVHVPAMDAAREYVPAANILDYPITTLPTAIDAEDGKPYAQRPVTRAYVARSLSRALDSQERHAEKYTAQDVRWLAEHNADHAFRNSVITGEEFAEIYHLIRAENARPLAILAAIRDALLSGAPVMPAARAA